MLLAFLAILGAGSAQGHGSQLVVEPPIAAPGTEVAVHGDFLWTDAAVQIGLAGTLAPREPIASATVDGDGHLEARATLPDLRAGTYVVVVTNTATGETVEAELIVETSDLLMPIALGFGVLLLGVLALGRLLRARR